MEVKFKRLRPDAMLPRYAKEGDAGLDFFAIGQPKYVNTPATQYVEYRTGVAIEIPYGYVGLLFPRSSISHTTLALTNSVGVIDAGYRGEITFRFRDTRTEHVTRYSSHERIGQLVILPFPKIEVVVAEELSESERGENGYGSSGAV